MASQTKNLKKQLLKIQIDKENHLLKTIKETDQKKQIGFISIKKKNLEILARNMIFIILTIPILYVYFDKFIVPISRYENYTLMKDINSRFEELQISKVQLGKMKTQFDELTNLTKSFSDNMGSIKETIFLLSISMKELESFQSTLTETNYYFLRDIYIDIYNNMDTLNIVFLSNQDSIICFAGRDTPSEIFGLISLLSRIDSSFLKIKMNQLKSDNSEHFKSSFSFDNKTFSIGLLLSNDFNDFLRNSRIYSIDLFTLFLNYSMKTDILLNSYNKSLDSMILDIDKLRAN